jgi:uncharacterized repeat protein (TIGR03803 family)
VGGAVFKVSSNVTAGSFNLLQPFSQLSGTLVLSGDMLYGATYTGGLSNQGTVFRMKTDGSSYQILHSFGGAGDGSKPDAGLVLSGSTLYGTTSWGGSSPYDHGTIFKIQTDGTGYSILKLFLGGTSGSNPKAV